MRRGGWRNVASVASSRDQSDISSGEDDRRSPSSSSTRPKRPSQSRTVSATSTGKNTLSRLASGSVAHSHKRAYNTSFADSGSGEDDALPSLKVNDQAGYDSDGSVADNATWRQLSDRLPVMTPPGAVVQLPIAGPSTVTATGDFLTQVAPDLDWANFVHAYARGRWDPNKPVMPPGRSTAFPGSTTKIVLPMSEVGSGSDAGLTFSDAGSDAGRRPSLSYESDGEPGIQKPPMRNGQFRMPSIQSTMDEQIEPDLQDGAPSPVPQQHKSKQDIASKISRDLRMMQFSTASSPELSIPLQSGDTTPQSASEQTEQFVEKMQRASKSLNNSQSPHPTRTNRNTLIGAADDSVWVDSAHAPPSPKSSNRDVLGQNRDEPSKPVEATGSDKVSANAAVAFVEAFKRADGDGPHRPGPTPVQPTESIGPESVLSGSVQNSAPAGLADPQTAVEEKNVVDRSLSDSLTSAKRAVTSGVDALRLAARRASVKRSEHGSHDDSQPTTIHSEPRSSSDLQKQLLEATTPPGAIQSDLQGSSGSPDEGLMSASGGRDSAQDVPTERKSDSEVDVNPERLQAPEISPTRIRTTSETRVPTTPARRFSVPSTLTNNYISKGQEAEAFYVSCGYLPAITPPNEKERRDALRRYGPPKINGDPNFDRLGHLVRLVFNCRIVLISLVGATQQVFQTAVGGGGELSAESLQRIAGAKDCSFCAHAILQTSEEPLVILDAQADWRFMGNPLVLGPPHIRFYAGTPLRTPDGLNLGSLCVIDTEARPDFSPRQRHTLKEFGRVVMRELELTRDQIHLNLRDRMQRSIELFTRDCLEMEVDATEAASQDGKDAKVKAGMGNLYNFAARAMYETLQAAGAVVFDLSHFELIESPAGTSGGKSSKIFFPSPYSAPDVTPYASFDDPSAIETITSTPGPRDDSIKTKAVAPMSVLGASESQPAPPERLHAVPLTHHIKVAEFLRKHRTGHFYPMVPSVFRHLLPADSKGMLLVPIFGINKQPFALLCAYAKARQEGPMLEDLKDTALQYMRSMGTIILSAVLKKDIMLADQAKSHFISNISHELRTPLHGILASAELLAETKLNATQGSYLETVEACGKSLLELVNHVLDFTKLSGASRAKSASSQSLTPTDLVRLLQEVCESSWIGQMARKLESQQSAGIGSAYATGSGGTVSANAAPQVKQMRSGDVETVMDISMRDGGWLVSCDAGGVRRVLMNLIGNALKFTTAGFVHISLREVQSTPSHVVVELSVTDTGKGISKAFLEEQLFHPFTQENQLGPGTGLGLSIVNSIVQSPSINGKIDVWSTVGEGTEMRITCEMELVQPEDIDGPVYRPCLNMAQSRCISLAGFQGNRGQLDLKQVLRNYFEGWWRFAPCRDGSEAYDGDIVLINEDPQLFQAIRRHRKVLPPVILLTSARGDAESADACRAYHDAGGIARMVFKPTGPAKLEAVVDFCLQCLERIDNGEPPDIKQTSPTTPLPSPKPLSTVVGEEERDNYFAPRPHDATIETPEIDRDLERAEDHTPMQMDASTPTSYKRRSGNPTPTRPPVAHLRTDSHHISPRPLDSSSAMLIRRHSAEDEISNKAVQKTSAVPSHSGTGMSPASSRQQGTSINPHPVRPLLPARSITFHTEPRLNKQVAVSPSASRSGENSDDYFSAKKLAPRDSVDKGNEHTGASPGSLVPIEGSGDGHVLRSAIGTVRDPKPHGKRIRVLGVDDNEINIKVLSAFLSKLDVDFTPASSGEQSLQLFDTAGPFDVVIVDITMPGLDGFQVTAAIRARENRERPQKAAPGSKVSSRAKVLCLTGRNTEEDKRRAFASGADGFITRPLSLRSLSSILKLLTDS